LVSLLKHPNFKNKSRPARTLPLRMFSMFQKAVCLFSSDSEVEGEADDDIYETETETETDVTTESEDEGIHESPTR